MGTEEFDVVVAGAGASGVPAAVAAAREGARVALLEKEPVIGGTVRMGLGFPICGLFVSDSDEPVLANGGLAAEFVRQTPGAIERRGRVFVYNGSGGAFTETYQRWIDAEPNLTLFTGVPDPEVLVSGKRMTGIRAGSLNLTGRAFIDCSGEGVLIQGGDAKRIRPENPALSGYVLRLEGVTPNDMLPINVPYALRRAVDAGQLPGVARYTVFDAGILKISLEPGMDAQAFSVAAVEVLKVGLPEFKDAVIAETSGRVLHREGTRLNGEVAVNEEDVRIGQRFDDSVARGCWPMEHWHAEKGVTYVYGEGTYDIPLRALKSSTFENLWAAGRLVSSDSMALSSLRVAGTCMATGEAAGRAAAKEAA